MRVNEERRKRDRNKALLVALPILGGIAFMMFGITAIFPPALTAHSQPVMRHDHVQLHVYQNEAEIKVPANIGQINDYFMKERVRAQYYADLGVNGWAPLHTHDDSGILHIETVKDVPVTFGDFEYLWATVIFELADERGQTIYLDGTPVTLEELRLHVLHDGDKLTILLA